MKNTIVKYRNAECLCDDECFLKAVYTDSPSELIKTLKEVMYVEIEGGFYKYSDSIYKVPEQRDILNVVSVYLEELD